MFRDKYPLAHNHLSMCIIDNQLDLEQIRGMVRDEKRQHPGLQAEIEKAFNDESISWRALLNDPSTGEILMANSEAEAIAYARKLFDVE